MLNIFNRSKPHIRKAKANLYCNETNFPINKGGKCLFYPEFNQYFSKLSIEYFDFVEFPSNVN